MSKPRIALLAAACVLAFALPHPVQAQSAEAKPVISTADQLPRRTVKLDKLPSLYLSAPRAEVQALADQLEANARADLAKYDIRDPATLRAYYGTLMTLAQFKDDWAAVPALTEQLRALQDKPGPRAITGVLAGVLGEQQMGKKDAAWMQAEVTRRYGALNWPDVGDSVKGMKGQLELFNPALVRGSFEQQLDVMARNMNLDVPEGIVGAIIGARLQEELILPNQKAIVAGLQVVIDRHASVAAKPDRWTPRTFALAPDAAGTEVGIGIWDSGVDMKLFKPTFVHGIAFENGVRSNALLRPLGDAAPRWPQLQQLVKGSMDLRAALDTPDARKLKEVVTALKADEAKRFQEDLALVGLYTHGTHVAGIAVDGNPFARVFAASMLWSHKSEPIKPTQELAERNAISYQMIVSAFQAQKLRVVNMSWRYGASAYEGALAWHNLGGTPDERKQLARKLFAIERDALRAAIASAPEILFIAGSGNEDNSADFAEYIPAGFELPNLITVGAVDKAGEETSFSTFGKTVVVHANGYEVESYLPGGDKVKFSGTSMASPQVANLAAKLFALKPSLSVAEVRQAILDTAERQGRVNLVHPRKAAQALGIKL